MGGQWEYRLYSGGQYSVADPRWKQWSSKKHEEQYQGTINFCSTSPSY